MKKFCRVFLKGPVEKWWDFPLPDTVNDLFFIIGKLNQEGFICDGTKFIVREEIRAMCFIQIEPAEAAIDFTRAKMN